MRYRALIAAAVLLLGITGSATGLATFVPAIITEQAEIDVAYIQDGLLVTNLNNPNERGVIARYTGIEMGEAVREVRCSARFYGGGAIALVVGPLDPWSIGGITAHSLHAVFTAEGYHFGFYENGQLTDVLAGEYLLDTSGETEYTFGLTIKNETLTLQLPNGKTDRKVDARIPALGGSRVIFEHYLTEGDVAVGASPAIASVYAKGAAGAVLDDSFDRSDGLPVLAPTGQVYVQFRNQSAQ